MAEVRALDGSILEDVGKGAGEPRVINMVREILELAMSGEACAIALVYKAQDRIITRSSGTWRGSWPEAIGALAMLQHDMMSASNVG